MEIKLLKKCVDSFCPLILSEFGVCLKVMMIDQIDYMHFERWTVKLLVTLEMKKKKQLHQQKNTTNFTDLRDNWRVNLLLLV